MGRRLRDRIGLAFSSLSREALTQVNKKVAVERSPVKRSKSRVDLLLFSAKAM
jgi:hypothetical protein